MIKREARKQNKNEEKTRLERARIGTFRVFT